MARCVTDAGRAAGRRSSITSKSTRAPENPKSRPGVCPPASVSSRSGATRRGGDAGEDRRQRADLPERVDQQGGLMRRGPPQRARADSGGGRLLDRRLDESTLRLHLVRDEQSPPRAPAPGFRRVDACPMPAAARRQLWPARRIGAGSLPRPARTDGLNTAADSGGDPARSGRIATDGGRRAPALATVTVAQESTIHSSQRSSQTSRRSASNTKAIESVAVDGGGATDTRSARACVSAHQQARRRRVEHLCGARRWRRLPACRLTRRIIFVFVCPPDEEILTLTPIFARRRSLARPRLVRSARTAPVVPAAMSKVPWAILTHRTALCVDAFAAPPRPRPRP